MVFYGLLVFMGGLSIFDPEQELFWQYKYQADDENSLSSNAVWHIFEDSYGTIWISTASGLQKVRVPPNGIINYDSLSFELVPFIGFPGTYWVLEDKAKRFWISQWNRLVLYDRKDMKLLKGFKWKSGYPLDVANSMLEDNNGNLWLFGTSGIVKFDPEKETFLLFDKKSGIPYAPFGRLARKNEDGWFFTASGKNGFYVFNPESIEANKNPPKILITDFRLFNQSVEPGEKSPLSQPLSSTSDLSLKYHQNNLAFEYIGLHYDRSEKIQYAYQLTGIDPDWVLVDQERIARYPKLPPGNYTFTVKAANADGIWNEQGASINISIAKPWWNTWLAFVLYAIGFTGVVFFYLYC